MKSLVIITMLFIASNCLAETTFVIEGRQGTKVDALRALITNSNANVVKCQAQELSDKATLRNKRVQK